MINLRRINPLYWKLGAIALGLLIAWLIYSSWRTDIANRGRWEQGQEELGRIKKENRAEIEQLNLVIKGLREKEVRTQVKIVQGKDRIITIEKETNVELEKVDSLDSVDLRDDVIRRARAN